MVRRPWSHVVLILVLVCLLLPAAAGAASQTITFDDLSNPNRALNGQYPTGVIDWGTNVWYLSGPFGAFTTQSISYNGASATSAPFTFVTPQRLLQLDAYNGGRVSSTITLSCAGQTTKTTSIAVGQLLTIQTGWTGTCTSVTIGSTNGWDTNFDNLVIDNGLGPLISNVQSSPTSSGATITWTTNIASTSAVDYGPTSAYGSSTPVNPTLVTTHSVTLTGLSQSATYHYRVRSADGSGNSSSSGDFTFTTTSTACDPPVTNPIACENSKPGDPASSWDLASHDAGDPSIQGFATDISFNIGQTVRFKISTPATAYRLDIYRMGYYGGQGARKQATVTPIATLPQTQPACLSQSTTGLIDCGNWADSATWTIPSTAVSGIYFAKVLRTDTGGASHIFFIVRDDSSTAPLLFQTSDTTWQAYNSYGGNSLYIGGPGTNPARAYKVSYNRPINTRSSIQGLGPPSMVWNAEYPMVRFLEANGYNMSYMSGVDTDRRGAAYIQQHKTYLSVGHDEYWSGGERSNVESARAAGVNLAFFSGNETFWKTRWENSIDSSNTPYRTLVSYKETHANTKIDPADPPTWTGTWRDPRFSPPADGGKPENALHGPIFMVNGTDFRALTVQYAYSRLRFWRNTAIANMAPGGTTTITAGCSCLIGYEWDVDLDNGFRPAGLVPLSSTTANVSTYLQDYGSTYGAGTATHMLTLYRASSGALVFGAGTVSWSWGLDGNHDNGGSTPDPNIQQATVNILADMGAQPSTLQPGLVAASQSTDTVAPVSTITSPANGASVPNGAAFTITGTASDASGQVGAVEVSVDGGTTWHRATGTTSWTYSWTPAALGTVTIKSRASDDSGNVETPGAGVTVTVKGVITVDFNNLTANTVLNGQYPSGVIDWGTNNWYVSGPWLQFTTNSVSYNGAGPTSKTFSLLQSLRLVQVDAFNGGTVSSTVTISCAGEPTVTRTVAVNQLVTISTGWTSTCSGTMTVGSTNGWDTNIDNLIFDQGP